MRSAGTTAAAGLSAVPLPVVGCATTHGAPDPPDGVPSYLPSSRTAKLPADQVSALVWFEGDTKSSDGLRLLGPRGWQCAAGIGANGSWSMTLRPPGTAATDASGQEVSAFGEANGPGSSTACAVFASAKAVAPAPDLCVAPAGAAVTLNDAHLAWIDTPAGGKPGSLGSRSFMLWYPEAGNSAEGAACRLPDAQHPLCQTILDEALARQRSATESFIAAHPAAPQPTSTATPAQPAASGILARASNGALFIQWTLTSSQADGNLTEVYTDPADPTQATTATHPFNGIVSGRSVTITLDDSTKWVGTLDGPNATLSYTSSDGTVHTFTFSPATTDEFNAAVAKVQGGASAAKGAKDQADAAARQAQQEANAKAKAQSSLDDDASAVNSDITSLRASVQQLTTDLGGVPGDLKTMRADLATQAAHLHALLTGGSLSNKCTNGAGYQVSSTDNYQVTSTDDYQITSTDDYAITNDLSALDDGIAKLNQDAAQASSDQAASPNLVATDMPTAQAINAAQAAAQAAKAAGETKRGAFLATVKQLDAQSDVYASQADKACNNTNG